MANRFTAGKNSISECDRCGQRFKLKDLKKEVIKTKQVSIKVCNECWSPDHPQLQLGMQPIADPQAVRDPRPDFAGYAQSRSNIVPVQNFLNSEEYTSAGGAIGTVTLDYPVPVFLDTFTGPAGPLGGHTPDIGSNWSISGGYTTGLTNILLDGSGVAYISGVNITAVESPISMSGAPAIVNATIVIPATPTNLRGVSINLEDASFAIVYNVAGSFSWNYIINGSSGSTGWIPFALGSGDQNFTFEVTSTTATLKYNGTVLNSLIDVYPLVNPKIKFMPQLTGAVSSISVQYA